MEKQQWLFASKTIVMLLSGSQQWHMVLSTKEKDNLKKYVSAISIS